MHDSAILIIVRPGALDATIRDLEALPGVEVYHCDPERGRLIAVQESRTAEQQQAGLRRIQALPRVLLAALVEHRIEPESASTEILR